MTLFKASILTFLILFCRSALAEDKIAAIGSNQFIDGMKAARSADGTQHGGGKITVGQAQGGYDFGGLTTAPYSSRNCDPKQNIAEIEKVVTKGVKLIAIEPCGQGLQEQGTIKKFSDQGVKFIVARRIDQSKNPQANVAPDNDEYKGALLGYFKQNDQQSLLDLQDYGVGLTIGMAIKSYNLQQGDLKGIVEPLKKNNLSAVTTILDTDNVLAVDGWSAAEDCNPCPKAGACPQKIVEAVKKCCGKAGACAQ